MLEIGNQWKDWKGYSAYGDVYFGPHSIPFKVQDNIYQVKCMCTKPCNNNQYETRYLQFNLAASNITFEFLESLPCGYINKSKYYGYYTNNKRVYLVAECTNPTLVRPTKHNARDVSVLYDRLLKMTPQKCAILK